MNQVLLDELVFWVWLTAIAVWGELLWLHYGY